jgi:hypothetical protein
MIVEKMKTKFGNDSKTQVIVHDDNRSMFISYGTPIAEIRGDTVTLDKNYWDYSATTGQYRNVFLGEGIADTRKKIKDGTYQLANLKPTLFATSLRPIRFDVPVNTEGPIDWPEAVAERCGTVGCTYCDPDNYDGWEDEDCSRQQVEADAKQCSVARGSIDNG